MSIQAVTLMCAGPTQPFLPITELTQFPEPMAETLANLVNSVQISADSPAILSTDKETKFLSNYIKQDFIYFIKICTMHLMPSTFPREY